MTVAAGRHRGVDRPVYIESARSYASALVLVGLLAAGFVVDLALGGGIAHLIGWLIALVLVVGVDVLVIRAARSLHTITVTGELLRVGEESVERERIVRADRDVAADVHVLGRGLGRGLPRGVPGLMLWLSDGSAVAVPTRHPDRLAGVLALAVNSLEVRPAADDELALLPEICARADTLFRVSGMELPPGGPSVEELRSAKAVLVAGRPPVGFAQIDELDGLAHLSELDVLPARMRQGIGSALLEAACSWAAEHAYPAITLTTFADVAWNAPFYAARGFAELREPGPELAEARDWERARGLDAFGRRVAMRRDLPAPAHPDDQAPGPVSGGQRA